MSILVPHSRHALKIRQNRALPGISSTPMLFGATRPAIPSCDFTPLQGFLPKALPDPLRCQEPLLGFPAVRRIRSERVYITPEIPISGLSSASRDSHPLRGLLLFQPCGFISPRIRPAASPFREFPSQGATLTHRQCHAVVPFYRRLRSRPQDGRDLRRTKSSPPRR